MSVSWHGVGVVGARGAVSVRGNETLHPPDWEPIHWPDSDVETERSGNQLSTSDARTTVHQSWISWENRWRYVF